MKNGNTYELTINGDVLNAFVRGRIAGIIVGVTNNPEAFTGPLWERTKTTGRWIFKRTRTVEVVYEFNAKADEVAVIDELVKRSYNRNGRRDFGYGIKLIKEEA